jgi:flagellar M-ring protein FliF
LKPGAHLAPQNVQAINHLVASAVEGLSPDAVSVLDMNGNLLGRPKAPATPDGQEASGAGLEYRHSMESDLLTKINGTLEPLLGANKFKAGVSVECDFSGGEQSEEIFDPARSVIVSSQRTEDSSGAASSPAGVPGTASTLPRPTSRPGGGSGKISRVTENTVYQSSRTVKKTRQPAGALRKMSLAVLVDQEVKWEKDKTGFQRVLVPPSPEKLKIIHDLVAGVTGYNAERGDQLVIETLPFETTLMLEPPQQPAGGSQKPGLPGSPFQLDRKTLMIGGGALAGVIVLGFAGAMFLRRRKKSKAGSVTGPMELPAPAGRHGTTAVSAAAEADSEIESQLADREALQHKMDAKALASLKLTPVITKKAEVLAKHLREKISSEPELSARVLRGWIREEDN